MDDLEARLGPNQKICLDYLRKRGGWPGTGWTWDNGSSTRRILDSLVRRGLAVIEVRDNRAGDPYTFYKAVKEEGME